MTGHIMEGFRQRAREGPDRVAVVDNEVATSYGELASQVNRLAATLSAAGVEPGDRVAVFVQKSAAAIVSFLGCLKVGAAYVPVDLAGPADRVARMMRVSGAGTVIVARPGEELLEETGQLLEDWRPVVGSIDNRSRAGKGFDFDTDDIDHAEESEVALSGSTTDIAQILFTSGSTGLPKGVAVKHGNVRHFMDWAVGHFGISHRDRLSGHPPFYFDLSTLDIYISLAAGAELHLVPPALNLLPHRLADFIAEHELTVWTSVPTVLTQLVSSGAVEGHDFPRLRHLLWCGELIPIQTLRALMTHLPHVEFTNLYGPTETTVASSFYPVTSIPNPDLPSVPIGAAIPGEELMILNDRDAPVGAGEMGQLAIAGAGVTGGYWDDPDRTGEVFRTRADGSRYYLTGDLARVDLDGQMYLLGRADDQVKTRGHRIELGEIEAALYRIFSVKSAAVVAVETSVEEGHTICCALVLEPDLPNDGIQQVRRELGALLPRYMFPRRWRVVDSIPVNANGKADRERLREWFAGEGAGADRG